VTGAGRWSLRCLVLSHISVLALLFLRRYYVLTFTSALGCSLLLTFAQMALDQEQAKDAEAKAEARRKFNESQAKMRAQVVDV